MIEQIFQLARIHYMEQIPVGLDSSHGLQRCQLPEQGGTTDAQMAGKILP